MASRLYCGDEDLRSMIDLLISLQAPDRVTDAPSIVDLRELVMLSDVRERTRLWLNENEQLVAFALVDPYANLRWEIDPCAATRDLESEMVSWGVACRQGMPVNDGRSRTLDASCREDDMERIGFLERCGFVRQSVRSVHLERSLNEPIPLPTLPSGFVLRTVAGESEADALAALHRAAFGTPHMTVEERLAMMRVPDYDPSLDLVIVAPDGRLAAYCLCSVCREENEQTGRNDGSTDPLATHPDWKRRGLGKALLLAGMRLLKSRGVDCAVLGTSSDNAAMLATAQSAGFHVRSVTVWFAKPIGQGMDRVERTAS